MSYLVLARKYRPQKFSDLTGQETISTILKSAILQNKVAHAYVFSGPRGTGKTTTARIFAKALSCVKRSLEGEPCNACDSCREITKGNFLDVMEIDAASHTGVEATREVIIESIGFAPVSGKYKIFIIDEVHMLSNHAFNALLKTLEEPPAHVVFILATTDFHKIPTTIASRCQRFRFLPLTSQQIISNLKKIAADEKISVSDDALALLARSAGGAMRDALSLFDQIISSVSSGSVKAAAIGKETVENILGLVKDDFLNQFLTQVADKNAKGVLESIRQALNEGYDLSQFLKELRESYRQMLIQKCGYGGNDPYLNVRAGLPVDRFTKEKLLRDIQLLTHCADVMRRNDLPHVVFESYAVRLCDDALSAEELLERINNLESALKGGGAVSKSSFSSAPQSVKSFSEPPRSSASVTSIPASSSTFVSSPATPASKPVSAFISSATRSAAVEAVPDPGKVERPLVSPSSSDIGSAWKKTLVNLQQSKGSIYTILQGASVELLDGKIDITFFKPFGLDAVKRHVGLIEEAIGKEAGRKIVLNLKLGKLEDAPRIRDEEAGSSIPSDKQEDATEAFDNTEMGEDVSSDLFAAQDAGVKKFMELFPGKITAPGEVS